MTKAQKIADKFVSTNDKIMLKDDIVMSLSKIKDKNMLYYDFIKSTLDNSEYRVYDWDITTRAYDVFRCFAQDIGMGVLKYIHNEKMYLMFPADLTNLTCYDSEEYYCDRSIGIWEFLCDVFDIEYGYLYEEIDE